MTEAAPPLRRKKPLSMNPDAVRSRRRNRRRKQRVVMVMVPISERDINKFERDGRLDLKLEQSDPTKAIAAAVRALLDAVKPMKK